MKLKANYHTHLALCGHATGMTMDYVLKAIELGFRDLGISDHLFVPREFMSDREYLDNWLERQMTEEDFYNIYLKDIELSINKYSDKINIYKGIETEYISTKHEHYKKIREKLDYMNLGIHFFNYDNKIYNVYNYMDKNLLDLYVENALLAMNSGLFKIFVHPDIFMYNYFSEEGRYHFDKSCINASKKLIECAIKNDMYLEINAGGLRQNIVKYNDELINSYPRLEFWKLVKEYSNAKVIIGADAHKTDSLDDDAIQKAFKIGEKAKLKIDDYIDF